MDRKTAFALVLGLLTLCGIWLLKISSPHGLGLTDDAISYIAASRALLAGQGFTRIWLASGLEPITHWPPFFSFSLATLSRVSGIEPYRSARVLNTLIFGANAGILGLLGYKMTKSHLAGILLSTLFLSNSSFLRLHAQALSEPLYLFISLLAFLAFYKAFEILPHAGVNSPPLGGRCPQDRGGQHKYLILAGLLTALSYLTRYAALSLLATLIVAIFILRPTWRKRFSSLAFFLAGALPVILTWMLRNKLVGGSATNRIIEWHPVTAENAQRGLRAFFLFIVPLQELRANWFENYSFLAIILSLITLILLFWLLPRGLRYFFTPKENTQPEILSFMTALYIFGYMGSLLVSLSLFDAATPLNDRILSPIYVAFLIMAVYFIHKLFGQGKIVTQIFSVALSISFLAIFSFAQVNTVKLLRESAQGFASWRWRESTVMEAIRTLPDDTLIYTNQPPAVYFWTDRPAMMIWDVEYMQEALRSKNAALAIFFPADEDSPEFQAWLVELTEGLEPIQKSGLGNLYRKK